MPLLINVDTAVLNGQTFAQWAQELFEYELCDECGGDENDHTPLVFLGNWFAQCKLSDGTVS